MGAKQQEEKKSFWDRYKFYLIGFVGAVLLIGSMSVQNVVVNYQTTEGTQYAVKLDYSAFGMCLRCYSATKNTADIVEKAIFFGTGKEKSVKNAAEGLAEIAETADGTFQLRVGGLLGNNEKNTAKLVEYLETLGYNAEAIQS